MPVADRSVVNQRLYFCRLHLDWLEEQLNKQLLPKHVIEQAMGESLVFHLVLVYKAFLAEIAQSCSVLVDTTLENASQLISLLENNEHLCSVAKELLVLESSNSWLFLLLTRYRKLGFVCSVSNASTLSSAIPAKQVETGLYTLELQEGQKLFDSLKAFIDQQRLQLEEW